MKKIARKIKRQRMNSFENRGSRHSTNLGNDIKKQAREKGVTYWDILKNQIIYMPNKSYQKHLKYLRKLNMRNKKSA